VGRLSSKIASIIGRKKLPERTEQVTGELWTMGQPLEDTTDATVGLETYRRYALEDCEVRSALERAIDGVVSRPWSIVPADEDDAKATEQAEFVQRNLELVGYQTDRTYQTTGTMLGEVLWRGLVEGLAIGEPVWTMDGGSVWLDSVAMRSREDFLIQCRTDGSIETIQQAGKAPLDPRSLLIAPYWPLAGNIYGSPVMRAVHKWASLKEICRKNAGIYALRAAGGQVVAKYPAGTSAADQARLKQYVKELWAESVAIMPSTTTVDIMKADVAPSNIYDAIIEMCDRQIRKLMLWAVLGTDFSGSAGSRASSEVTGGIQQERLAALGSWLEHAVNRSLVQRICDFNFDTSADGWEYHRYAIDFTPPVNRLEHSEIIIRLANIGGKFEPDYLARTLGVELVNTEPMGIPTSPGTPGASTALPDGMGSYAETERRGEKWRPLLERSHAALDAEIDALTTAIEPDLIKAVQYYPTRIDDFVDAARWLATHRAELNELNGTANGRGNTLLALARERGMDVPATPVLPGQVTDERLRDSAIRAARAGASLVRSRQAERLGTFAETWDLPDFVPQDVIDQLGDLLIDRYKFIGVGNADLFVDTLAEGLRNGWNQAQTADEYARRVGIDPAKATPDKANPNWNIRRDVMTALNEVYGKAHYQSSMRASWVRGWEYSATIDNLTTPFCKEHDGWQVLKGDEGALRYWPPTNTHYGCRSEMLDLFSDEIEAERLRDPRSFETQPDPRLKPVDIRGAAAAGGGLGL
jgi:hypothetical protein